MIILSEKNSFLICIACYNHSRGWENARKFCKPLALHNCFEFSQHPLLFISGYANTHKVVCFVSNVILSYYILGKNGNLYTRALIS